jgi:hypothetical protein
VAQVLHRAAAIRWNSVILIIHSIHILGLGGVCSKKHAFKVDLQFLNAFPAIFIYRHIILSDTPGYKIIHTVYKKPIDFD